ncbi:hypothetical protein [Phenylobacterium sp. NIBR 498073]|jgi:hypothetical protein|uniref:hypothetical protein n=1 Tax=Phenylobacterium sp. NIBR 498073 TaxID=3015177 RepID=UPI0022B4D1A6|nr:hypothetical protein [Phenylobacterium sp. NIBR 498073]MBS0490561.1 hypothetical protein [Pseudomonadota bacterium]WGU41512.1 hypothetical protein O4N75_07245 [Phenylobacterium sp. NIBR 498073]
MRLATSEGLIWGQGLGASHGLKAILERGVRPAVGFIDPLDVLKDPHLTTQQKREILCSWASDASAVQDEPRLRWLLGTPEPVRLDEIRAAIARLDQLGDFRPGPTGLGRRRRRSASLKPRDGGE